MIKRIVMIGCIHLLWAGETSKQLRIGLGRVNQKSTEAFPISSEAPAGFQIDYQWMKNITEYWQRGINMGWGTFAQAQNTRTDVMDSYYIHPNMRYKLSILKNYSLAIGSAAGLSITDKRKVDRGNVKSSRKLSYGLGGGYGVSLVHEQWSISAEMKHTALFQSDTFSWRELKIGYTL